MKNLIASFFILLICLNCGAKNAQKTVNGKGNKQTQVNSTKIIDNKKIIFDSVSSYGNQIVNEPNTTLVPPPMQVPTDKITLAHGELNPDFEKNPQNITENTTQKTSNRNSFSPNNRTVEKTIISSLSASASRNAATVNYSEIPQEKPKSAVLGFSYFPRIAQNETRDLRVFVKIEGNDQQVRGKLRNYEKAALQFVKQDDSSVVCIVKNIEVFKKLSIKPIYDTEDFRITRVDNGSVEMKDPNEQELDFKNGNMWHWKVKAIANSSRLGNITLLVNAETLEGQKIQIAERQIDIKIGIDQPKLTFSQKIYQLADAHFKEILSLIIIPFGLYLVSLVRRKLKANKEV